MVCANAMACTTGAEEGYKMEMEFITYAEYGEALELTQRIISLKSWETSV